jgi:hypothetical protein
MQKNEARCRLFARAAAKRSIEPDETVAIRMGMLLRKDNG